LADTGEFLAETDSTTTNTGETSSPVSLLESAAFWREGGAAFGFTAWLLKSRIQNAPSRIAPTNMMAAQAARTSSFKAMPTRWSPRTLTMVKV
jgi:hypothetical protein